MSVMISAAFKKVVFDLFTDPEKLIKAMLIFILLPILIFLLVFAIPAVLAVSVPAVLVQNTADSESMARQLDIISYYYDAALTIEQEVNEWIESMKKEYSWCDDIDVRKDFSLSWQKLIAIDTVIISQDFNKVNKNEIVLLGEKFIVRSCSTETYIVIVRHSRSIYENGVKIGTEVWYEEEERTRAIIKVNTKPMNEVFSEIGFNSFEQQVANNIFSTISDTYSNFSIIDEAGRYMSNIAIDAEKYPLGNLNRLTGDNDINEIFAGRLAALADKYDRSINIVSGYRSVEEQQRLWDQRKMQYPGEPDYVTARWVARPGHSRHQYGIAADVSGWAKDLSNAVLIPFGLYKPMIYENWHIEPIETMRN